MHEIFQHELKYYFKNKVEAIYLYSYFISIIVLFPFAMRYDSGKLQELATIALWIALASGIALGAAPLFRREAEQGRLDYFQLLPLSLEGIVAAKWAAFFLFITLPLLATLPIAGLLYNLSPHELGREAVGLIAGAAGLSILSTLVAALTTGLEKAGSILSLIMLPLSIPLMVFGAAFCRSEGPFLQENLLFLAGFSLFMLPVMCIAGAYSIRAGN